MVFCYLYKKYLTWSIMSLKDFESWQKECQNPLNWTYIGENLLKNYINHFWLYDVVDTVEHDSAVSMTPLWAWLSGVKVSLAPFYYVIASHKKLIANNIKLRTTYINFHLHSNMNCWCYRSCCMLSSIHNLV